MSNLVRLVDMNEKDFNECKDWIIKDYAHERTVAVA